MRLRRLHPTPSEGPLEGTYLDEPIGHGRVGPFVYANFLTTLDGRIALDEGDGHRTPAHARSAADWALFQELQAHADVLVTHGGYLRSLAAGELGDVLSVEETGPFGAWRRERGLAQQPDVLVVSRSLDFDPELLPAERSRVLTSADASAPEVARLERAGLRVDRTDAPGLVPAAAVLAAFDGAPNVYLQTGPDLAHSMLAAGVIARLYLTLDLSVAGGLDPLSFVRGPAFANAPRFRLAGLHLGGDGTRQQLFAALERAPSVP